jgi:hypothetical protein
MRRLQAGQSEPKFTAGCSTRVRDDQPIRSRGQLVDVARRAAGGAAKARARRLRGASGAAGAALIKYG